MTDVDVTKLATNRKEALDRGEKKYFTGKPCKHGHIVARYVYQTGCPKCSFYRLKEWRKNNPEENRRRQNATISKNREKYRERGRARYAKNPEKFINKTKRYYKEKGHLVREKRIAHHREKSKDAAFRQVACKRADQWRKDNPERYKRNSKVQKHRRRAREKSAEGFFCSADLSLIFESQNGKCVYCQIRLGLKYHVDHIVPISKGGSNWPKNLQLLCGPCNLSKADRDPIEYANSLGLLF